MEKEKIPEGQIVGKYIAIFIAVFSGIGVPISISTGNNAFIGIGPGIGVAIGVAVGQSIENKYKEQGLIRPLTEKEKSVRRKALYFGIGALILGVLVFLLLLFL